MQHDETLLRCCLLDTIPILGTKDIPAAILCTTMARLWGLVIHPVSVVVGKFLARLNILNSYNPNGIAELFRVAVGLTRVIDKTCSVLGRIALNGVLLIQAKDIDVASG
jgi:hypothetical protein